MVHTHALSRDERADRARNTVNKVIPEYLRTSPRARHGIHKSVMIEDPQPKREDSPTEGILHPSKIRIRVKDTDTFTAARQMTYSSRRASMSANISREQATRRVPNVCILNQASAIKPGGGFLDGVHSQEEFLCQRSTLFASLWDKLYPLPEVGGIFSSDVLVFGDSTPEAEELSKKDRIYVDVISASMIRFPGALKWKHDSDEIRPGCSCGVSYCDQDRELVQSKMQGVLRIAQENGCEKLVLGAWGCGAYANPPKEVARLWKKAICGTTKFPVSWPGIKEIVFAVTDRPALKEFEKCFADVIASAAAEADRSPPPERSIRSDTVAKDQVQDLITEIQETEIQLAQLQNPRTRGRLRDKLTNLNKQLAELGKAESTSDDNQYEDDDDVEAEDGFVVQGYPASDNEDNSYYNFDENDVASSSSATPASTYEFRFEASPPQQRRKVVSGTTTPPLEDESYVHAAVPESVVSSPSRSGRAGPQMQRMSSFEREVEDRRRLGETGGWFSGSVNELSALLRKTGAGGVAGLNPALSPAEPRQESAAFPEF
ncbi:hypothetical protein K461DRAFT_59233 [Myriangium duriaei CBS 260.36]|uniref:Microbial-type PARG catalytic domain-containing protein n=1 Tax=Myriangium duriaei CBS 260.36 TaxID=1168546 RepID=A0A9P4MHU7_9PEZI|nr:hypothetical protein K461DRAFT_59233 [Myriangium duriaei CBS 260.36]